MTGKKKTRTARAKGIKCLVWDLDNTLWDGTLLENETVTLKTEAAKIIKVLDRRGILHSVASRGDYATAMGKLHEFGLAEYFLYPQINWGSKVESLKEIAARLGIHVTHLAFIDDQIFEREEVKHFLPEVLCFDAAEIGSLRERKELKPVVMSTDSSMRRRLYQAEQVRLEQEEKFAGSKEEFLATLGMSFDVGRCRISDLNRARELTVRTHQMNATGYTYSSEQLAAFVGSNSHLVLIAGLEDKFGSYGKIGLALVETRSGLWTIKLLLMSCRVVSRGVGTVLLSYIMQEAKKRGVRLQAEFRPNPRNRIMQITYRFAGFQSVGAMGDVQIFETNLEVIQPYPPYVQVKAADDPLSLPDIRTHESVAYTAQIPSGEARIA